MLLNLRLYLMLPNCLLRLVLLRGLCFVLLYGRLFLMVLYFLSFLYAGLFRLSFLFSRLFRLLSFLRLLLFLFSRLFRLLSFLRLLRFLSLLSLLRLPVFSRFLRFRRRRRTTTATTSAATSGEVSFAPRLVVFLAFFVVFAHRSFPLFRFLVEMTPLLRERSEYLSTAAFLSNVPVNRLNGNLGQLFWR